MRHVFATKADTGIKPQGFTPGINHDNGRLILQQKLAWGSSRLEMALPARQPLSFLHHLYALPPDFLATDDDDPDLYPI